MKAKVVGGNEYQTLAAAIEAATAGEEIVILVDQTITQGFDIDKSLILNLDNHTVTFNGVVGTGRTYVAEGFTQSRAFKITGSADFTVKNGEVALNEALLGSIRFNSTGTLTLENYTTNNSRGWGLNIKLEDGTAVLNNVTVNSVVGGGLEVNGPATATVTNCKFNQTGLDTEAWISTNIGVAYGGELTVNGGTFNSENYSLYVYTSGGQINVKDGTFISTSTTRPVIAAELNRSTYPTSEGGLQIEGGNFTGTYKITAPAFMSITGGTFSSDPTAYVADGYTTSGSNPWTVIKREGAVFNLTELQAAISNGVTPIYYAGEAITEAFTLAPAAATVINGLKVNHQTVAANATTLTINGDVTLDDAEITTKAYCGISVSEGKKVTLKDCVVDGSSASASDSRAMNINGGAVVTIDGSTIKGPATAGYSRCLNILDDGAKVDVINGSTLSVSHYAVNMPSSTVNAVVNVKNSSVNTGWAISNIWKTDNTVNFEACTLNSLNDKDYHTSNAFSAFVFNTTSSGNKVTVKDCAVSVRSTTGNFQTLVSLRNSGDAISFIGENTISLKDEALNQVIDPAYLGKVNDNTLTFDAGNLAAVNDYLDADCVVTGPVDNLYTVTYVAQVFYYWDTNDGQEGAYCSLADPFESSSYILSNGEYIRLEKDIALTKNITVTLSDYLTAGNYFTMQFGDYTITKGNYSIILPAGLSVKTDKQTDVFTAADGAELVETVENDVYTYTARAKNYVAQIGDDKYESLPEAFAAAQDNETITLLDNVSLTDRLFVNAGATPAYAGTGNRYATTSENKSITLDLNGKNITSSSNIALAGGTLNIISNTSATISTSADGLAPVEVRGTGDLANKRTLTVGQNVTLNGSTYGLNVFGSNTTDLNKIEVNVNGTVNGTLFVLGNLKNTENEITINVNGTVYVAANNDDERNVGVALNGYASVNVASTANVSGESGIEVRAGVLTVNGGTITGTADDYSCISNGDGSSTKGAAIAVVQHTTALPIIATINGGTLSGVKQLAVANPENTAFIDVSVKVPTALLSGSVVVPENFEWKNNEDETSSLVVKSLEGGGNNVTEGPEF